MDYFTVVAPTAKTKAVDGVVDGIMRIHKMLPTRPDIEEVEAAINLIKNVEREEQQRLESISKLSKGKGVPEELFYLYQEMQKRLVNHQSKELKRDAVNLLDLDYAHKVFDEMLQRACQCVLPSLGSGSSSSSVVGTDLGLTRSGLKGNELGGDDKLRTMGFCFDKGGAKSGELFSKDDSFVDTVKGGTFKVDRFAVGGVSVTPQIADSTLKIANLGQDGEKLSLIKLASLIEVSIKKGTKEINLQNKLSDQVEWLPDSIGKLSSLTTLDLSENRIVALPVTIGGLSSLTRFDLHSNMIAEVPESIGDLLNLGLLDLRGNYILKLPPCIGRLVRLEELDLSSNNLISLPDTIGSLVNLKKLNVETNELDELPHTIGQCSSLHELRLDYNRIRALPEAVGKITSLKILSVRYNNIRQLPTTMLSLTKLRELDVSFNELESVPESLCFATSLVKLNISNNFADLRSLPRSIGNLEMLQELDISNNQIHVLPDSFRFLTRLSVLYSDQNPLEVPPRHIVEKGAQAVVQYMVDVVANKDVKVQPIKQKKIWAQICFFSQSNKRKRSGLEYLKT